jgi:hypothetical protein
VTAPEGPATVTLTDDERALIQDSSGAPGRLSRAHFEAVARIVAARVAALTADLATARLARSVLMDELNDMTRDNDERARVIANVRALADDWYAGFPDERAAAVRLRALLTAAPTGEES